MLVDNVQLTRLVVLALLKVNHCDITSQYRSSKDIIGCVNIGHFTIHNAPMCVYEMTVIVRWWNDERWLKGPWWTLTW